MSFTEFLGHLAFVIVAGSFLVKDIMYLRVLSIVACTISIFFNYFGFDSPIWLVIFWQMVFIMINVVQIGILIKDKLGVEFSEEEKELYDTQFCNMSPVEFMKFMRLSEWKNLGANTVIIKEDQPLSSITLIYNGVVEIHKKNRKINTVKDGTFLGDVEFFSKLKASATAISTTDIRLVVWPFDELKKLLKMNPSMLISLNSALSTSLAKKLVQSNNQTCD